MLNKTGFTLVEVLIALVVALLVFLALMQTALVGINANMRNVLRDEAISIADMRMHDARSAPFTAVLSDAGSLSGFDCPAGFSSTGVGTRRNLRNVTDFNFCTALACRDFGTDTSCATDDSDTRQITVTVGWRWKGENYNHTATSIRKR
jgi:prepilin-type N-terminal cleavage/methylation domain-containing protein